MLGASRRQIITNLIIKFQQYSLLSSIIGLLTGSFVIEQYNKINSINIIGLTIKPIFSLEGTIIGLIIINTVILVLLFFKLAKIDTKNFSMSKLR